jgi:hypothetical protein
LQQKEVRVQTDSRDHEIDELFERSSEKWLIGHRLWSFFYYLLGLTAIVVPATISTGLIDGWPQLSKFLLAAVSISVSIIGWQKPGAKATAYEHALLGLRTLIVEYRTGNADRTAAIKQYKALLALVDYEYIDKAPT